METLSLLIKMTTQFSACLSLISELIYLANSAAWCLVFIQTNWQSIWLINMVNRTHWFRASFSSLEPTTQTTSSLSFTHLSGALDSGLKHQTINQSSTQLYLEGGMVTSFTTSPAPLKPTSFNSTESLFQSEKRIFYSSMTLTRRYAQCSGSGGTSAK